jgi:hypothetical protein
VEILPRPIPQEKLEQAEVYVAKVCATIRKLLPPDFDASEIEDQKVDIGNVIYSQLNAEFTEGEILTIRNTIFSLLRQPQN